METHQKTKLGLVMATDPRWVNIAEMQIEEADIALANTLDTLRATGAGAGGATALAQAALQSKKGVAASIEQQESQNEKLRERLQYEKPSVTRRVQKLKAQYVESQKPKD